MNFNKHSNLEGQHAFLGASKYHWINYSEEKVADAYAKFLATQRGTMLHAFAAQCILLGQKLPKSQKTLNMYVNDAIGYKMTPEQILYYSPNCFGTADAISFRNNMLRIDHVVSYFEAHDRARPDRGHRDQAGHLLRCRQDLRGRVFRAHRDAEQVIDTGGPSK